MASHAGGCFCGALRFEARTDPLRVTLCRCRICERAAAAAHMLEPIFRHEDLPVTKGTPAIYSHRPTGNGRLLHVNF